MTGLSGEVLYSSGGSGCTFHDSIRNPLVDPNGNFPNPCFLASVVLVSHEVIAVIMFYQIVMVTLNNKHGPYRVKYSFGNAFSVRSVGMFQFIRVSLAFLQASILAGLAIEVKLREKATTVVTTTAIALLAFIFTLAVPLHILEVTRTVVGHGSLLAYWLLSALSFLVVTTNDIFSSSKVFASHTDNAALAITWTIEIVLTLTSTVLFVTERYYYFPSKELFEYYSLNEWDVSSTKNLAEVLSFSWVVPVMKQIRSSGEATIQLIPNLVPSLTSVVVKERFEDAWFKQAGRTSKDNKKPANVYPLLQSKTKPSLLLILLQLHWLQMVKGVLFMIGDIMLSIASPFFIRAFIQFFTQHVDGNDSKLGPPLIIGIALSISIFSVTMVQPILRNQASLTFCNIKVGIQSALTTAIYEKSIKLSNAARSEKTIGEITNHVSLDITMISGCLELIASLFTVPLRLVLSIIALHKLLGNFMWVGIAVILVMSPLSSSMSVSISGLFKSQMQHRDERLKLMSEILSSIKSIKLYAWEGPFLDRLDVIRNEKELECQKRIGVTLAISQLIWESIPDWISYAVFATFGIYSKRILSPDLVFSSYNLFGQLL